MTAKTDTAELAVEKASLGFFERYLTLWVVLCIGAGIGLGNAFPQLFQSFGKMEIAQVNLPVATLIWLMIIPMLLKIDFAALREVGGHWRGISVTLFINWAVKPFSMAGMKLPGITPPTTESTHMKLWSSS